MMTNCLILYVDYYILYLTKTVFFFSFKSPKTCFLNMSSYQNVLSVKLGCLAGLSLQSYFEYHFPINLKLSHGLVHLNLTF